MLAISSSLALGCRDPSRRGKCTRAPGVATVNLGQVSQVSEGLGVAEGDKDDAMVGQRAHSSNCRRLLPAAQALQWR